MRLLFTSFPAYGHFHPLAPLALAAREAGHDVRLATGPDLVRWAKSCGIDGYPVGLGFDDVHQLAQSRYPGDDWDMHMFTNIWVRAALPDLLALSATWQPELVVHEELEYAGVLLATILGIPCVTHSWHAPVRPADSRRILHEGLIPVWAEQLPGRPVRMHGEIYLDACPAPLQSGEIAEIEGVVPVRPVLFDGPPAEVPAWLVDIPRPAAYVTLGTVPIFSTPDRLRLVAGAVAPLVAAVVLTTGPNPVETVENIAPNVRAAAYVPQSSLLERVDLVVSHGGAGGTLGALVHGLPHLVLPQGGQSQGSAARVIQEIGAGLSLAQSVQDWASIRGAAAELISDSRYKAAAELAGVELQDRPTPTEVVEILARAHHGPNR